MHFKKCIISPLRERISSRNSVFSSLMLNFSSYIWSLKCIVSLFFILFSWGKWTLAKVLVLVKLYISKEVTNLPLISQSPLSSDITSTYIFCIVRVQGGKKPIYKFRNFKIFCEIRSLLVLFSAILWLFISALPSSHLYMSTILFLLMILIPPWCHSEINPWRTFTQQKILSQNKRITYVSFRQALSLDS